MSFEIKSSDFTVIKTTSDWQPRPAIKEAMAHLCSVFSEEYPSAEFGDTWVSFDNIIGRTTIFATPIDIKTPDGFHLLDRLVVKTVLPEGVWQMSDSGTGGLVIVSHISGWLRLRARTARAAIGNFIFRGEQPRQQGPSIVSAVK